MDNSACAAAGAGDSAGSAGWKVKRRAPGRPRRARVSLSVLGSPRTQDTLQLGSCQASYAPGLFLACVSPADRLRNDPQRGNAVIAREDPGVVGQPAYVRPRPWPLLMAHDAGFSVALRHGQTVRVECRTGTGHEAQLPPTSSAPLRLHFYRREGVYSVAEIAKHGKTAATADCLTPRPSHRTRIRNADHKPPGHTLLPT